MKKKFKAPKYFVEGMKEIKKIRDELREEIIESIGSEVKDFNQEQFMKALLDFPRMYKKMDYCESYKDFIFNKFIYENWDEIEGDEGKYEYDLREETIEIK